MRSLPTLGGKCRILPSRRREGHSGAFLTPEGELRKGRRLQCPQHLRHFCHSVRHRPDRVPLPEHPLSCCMFLSPLVIYIIGNIRTPPFSEKPQGLISLLETIFRTHQPTWDDCQQILQTLFTSEERDRILSGAAKAVIGEEGETAAGRREVEDILPSQPPD